MQASASRESCTLAVTYQAHTALTWSTMGKMKGRRRSSPKQKQTKEQVPQRVPGGTRFSRGRKRTRRKEENVLSWKTVKSVYPINSFKEKGFS